MDGDGDGDGVNLVVLYFAHFPATEAVPSATVTAALKSESRCFCSPASLLS